MRFLAWNCQRCKSDPTICNLKSLLRSTSPIMTFISETHSSKIQSTNILRGLNAINSFIVPSSGLSGGLWLIWNNVHDLQIASSSPNFIVAESNWQLDYRSGTWSASTESPSHTRGKHFGQASSKISTLNLHVLCYGDFNAISS